MVHCHWMHNMGADLEKVELKFLKNQLPTLRVNCDIENGHPIVIFPESLVISLEQMGQEIPAIAHLLKLQEEGVHLNDTVGNSEYGEFAHEGMEGVNETIAGDTGEVKKERPPVGFTGS